MKSLTVKMTVDNTFHGVWSDPRFLFATYFLYEHNCNLSLNKSDVLLVALASRTNVAHIIKQDIKITNSKYAECILSPL